MIHERSQTSSICNLFVIDNLFFFATYFLVMNLWHYASTISFLQRVCYVIFDSCAVVFINFQKIRSWSFRTIRIIAFGVHPWKNTLIRVNTRKDSHRKCLEELYLLKDVSWDIEESDSWMERYLEIESIRSYVHKCHQFVFKEIVNQVLEKTWTCLVSVCCNLEMMKCVSYIFNIYICISRWYITKFAS